MMVVSVVVLMEAVDADAADALLLMMMTTPTTTMVLTATSPTKLLPTQPGSVAGGQS